MIQHRFPFDLCRMLPVLAGVLVLSAGAAAAACELPIRPPEPSEDGTIVEPGPAGPRQAEGAVHFDAAIMKFVECINGLWVPRESILVRRKRLATS